MLRLANRILQKCRNGPVGEGIANFVRRLKQQRIGKIHNPVQLAICFVSLPAGHGQNPRKDRFSPRWEYHQEHSSETGMAGTGYHIAERQQKCAGLRSETRSPNYFRVEETAERTIRCR